MGQSPVHAALEALTKLLEEEAIPHALCGAMALNAWGYERVTNEVDVLLEGEFPGDGKPKPVAFPSPSVAVQRGALPLELGASLDAFVRSKYEELWHAAQVFDPISES